jgi:hypothetical protein
MARKYYTNTRLKQVHRILFFLKFMLLWEVDENVIRKKLQRELN